MDNEEKPKPYTKYRSSRLRGSAKPLRKDPADVPAGVTPAGPPGVRKPAFAPKKRGRWARRLGLLLLMLILIALLAAGISYWRLDSAVRDSNARVPADAEAALTKPAGGLSSTPTNILFLGSDQRPDEPARADTILLMRVNNKDKTMSQLSLPRDLLVDIPGYGEGKINSAYAYGGPGLMIETVEQYTGIPIHHYVELDFSGFPAIVDSLGGVNIDVPKTIDSQYPVGYDWTQVHFDPGPQHMDGERALVYVRVRYSDDDFQRMGRQQQFMEALQKKLTSPGSLARMPLVAPEIIANMTTDLSTNDIIRLGWAKFRTPAANNHKFVLLGGDQYIDGSAYVVVDDDEARAVIREFLSG